MDRTERIFIVGMGALGILYGDFFAGTLGQEQVTFLANSDRVKNYKDYPVYCDDREWKFQVQDGAVPDSRGVTQLILSAVKATVLEAAARAVKNQVGKDTIILSVLSGISSEEVIDHIFEREHMLCCVAQGMGAVKLRNRLTHFHMGEICIGILESEAEKEPPLKKVADLFDETGLPYTKEVDILCRLWYKWMLNMGVNQAAMMAEGAYGIAQKPGRERYMMMDAMAEVMALVKKENIQVVEEDLQSYVDLVDTLNPGGTPSMRQDGLAHRRFEVGFFADIVIWRAEKHGLDVPVNQELYQRVTEMGKTYQAPGMVYIIKGTGAWEISPYRQ